MRRFTRPFAAGIAALTLSCAALAAPPTDASVESLLVLTKSEALLETMYGDLERLMRQGMQQAIGERPMSAEQQRVLDAAPREFAKVMREEMGWAKMKPMFMDIYRDSFDQEEIDGLIAFYRSRVGQSFVNKMPVVMQKSMAATQVRMGPLLEKMKAAMDRAIAEAKEKP